MTRTIKPEEVRNDLERSVLKSLKSFKRKLKLDLAYESETIPYVLEKTYVPDFIITRKDGTKLYIESKGYFRPEDRSKLLAIKRQNPDLDLRIIFQRNDKIKRSKSRYSDWAVRHSFDYHIGFEVPKEWLDVSE